MGSLLNYKHHYEDQICDINYHSRSAKLTYETWGDFYDEFCDVDINMNLIFRWDVKHEKGKCWCDIFMMQQRKGAFIPIRINTIDPKDEAEMRSFLSEHWKYLKEIWEPISH